MRRWQIDGARVQQHHIAALTLRAQDVERKSRFRVALRLRLG